MSGAPPRPFVARLLAAYCERHGHNLITDAATGHAGYVETKSGQRRFFRGCHFDLNPLGAAEVADDKGYALEFLARDGFSVPRGITIHSPDAVNAVARKNTPYAGAMNTAADAVGFAEEIGYPVFLKPVAGQEGEDVRRLNNRSSLEQALGDLFQRHPALLLQEAITGADLRIVILDGGVLIALERYPAKVAGDGASSIRDLAAGIPGLDPNDPRIAAELAAYGLDLEAVPAKGVDIPLLPNSNLSTGGTARNVTDIVDPALCTIAAGAAKALSLRFAGVDLIARDIGDAAAGYAILEINAAPGLNRYARQGEPELALVTRIYQKLFAATLGPVGN